MAEDLGELDRCDHLQLVEGARLGGPLGAPASECGGVAEPVALAVVVGNLADQGGLEGVKLELGFGLPSAGRRSGTRDLPPRVAVFVAEGERCQLADEVLASLGAESRAHPDVA